MESVHPIAVVNVTESSLSCHPQLSRPVQRPFLSSRIGNSLYTELIIDVLTRV